MEPPRLRYSRHARIGSDGGPDDRNRRMSGPDHFEDHPRDDEIMAEDVQWMNDIADRLIASLRDEPTFEAALLAMLFAQYHALGMFGITLTQCRLNDFLLKDFAPLVEHFEQDDNILQVADTPVRRWFYAPGGTDVAVTSTRWEFGVDRLPLPPANS